MPVLEDSRTPIDSSTQNVFSGSDLNPYKPEIAPDGKNISGNSWWLSISSHNNKISNLLINNYSKGIILNGPDASGNIIRQNYIGTDCYGTLSTGNEWGVYISKGASNNQIGPGNNIAYNDSDGVKITGTGSIGNMITSKPIYHNGGFSINNNAGGNLELTSPKINNV